MKAILFEANLNGNERLWFYFSAVVGKFKIKNPNFV